MDCLMFRPVLVKLFSNQSLGLGAKQADPGELTCGFLEGRERSTEFGVFGVDEPIKESRFRRGNAVPGEKGEGVGVDEKGRLRKQRMQACDDIGLGKPVVVLAGVVSLGNDEIGHKNPSACFLYPREKLQDAGVLIGRLTDKQA